MMDHPYLHVFEYFLLPFIIVVITSLMKFLAQKSRRKSMWHHFNIGLDLMIMTCFGLLIHGISIYSHVSGLQSMEFFVACTVAFVILLVINLLVVAIIRQYGEGTRRVIIISNSLGLACMLVLIGFVEKGAQFYKKTEETQKTTQTPPTSQKTDL